MAARQISGYSSAYGGGKGTARLSYPLSDWAYVIKFPARIANFTTDQAPRASAYYILTQLSILLRDLPTPSNNQPIIRSSRFHLGPVPLPNFVSYYGLNPQVCEHAAKPVSSAFLRHLGGVRANHSQNSILTETAPIKSKATWKLHASHGKKTSPLGNLQLTL